MSKRIVLAGDSAGGNLALVTAIRIRDAALRAPGCVVMLSPATDLTGASASLEYNRDRDPLLVPDALEFVRTTYDPGADWRHPWLSPIHDSFLRLPPLLFHAGSTELLVDDSIRAADKARWANVPVELDVWPGMPHVFQMMNVLPEARAAIAGIARFVQQQVPAPPRSLPHSTPNISGDRRRHASSFAMPQAAELIQRRNARVKALAPQLYLAQTSGIKKLRLTWIM